MGSRYRLVYFNISLAWKVIPRTNIQNWETLENAKDTNKKLWLCDQGMRKASRNVYYNLISIENRSLAANRSNYARRI